MQQAAWRAFVTVITVLAWITGAWLIAVRDVGSAGLSSAAGLSALVLFYGVPAVTFTPLARRWSAPFFEIEATLGWGTMAFVLSFVSPSPRPSTWQILALLIPLTVTLATILAAGAHLVALRLASHGVSQSFVDARRRGYLGATSIVAFAMLSGIGAPDPIIGVLLLAMCCMVELLVWTSRRPLQRDGRVTSARGS